MATSNFKRPRNTHTTLATDKEHDTHIVELIRERLEHYQTVTVYEHNDLCRIDYDCYRNGKPCYTVRFELYKDYGYYTGVRYDWKETVPYVYSDITTQEVLTRVMVKRIRKNLLDVLKRVCDEYVVTARFSNGETVYEMNKQKVYKDNNT